MEGEREVEKDYCLFVRERERERIKLCTYVGGVGRLKKRERE